MAKSNTIKFFRGLFASLSNSGVAVGEPKWATDTNDLYVGNGTKNVRILNENDMTEIEETFTLMSNNLSLKQDKLTAGTGITISNNVISSTASGLQPSYSNDFNSLIF